MFVLRAKVKIRDASADWTILAVLGAGASAALAAAGIPVPVAAGGCSVLDGGERVMRLPGGVKCAERFLLLARTERAAYWRELLVGLPPVGPELWWWSQIDAGIPAVLADTQELFVPQALNLEVLGGVNFRKGCYPGQEIVARSQYLGKLRRRMFLAHATDLGTTSDVYQDGAAEPVGRIVLAAGAPEGGWDLLFECPTERVAGNGLHAGSADAPLLQVRDLPYVLFDPTA
jgi:folate-binding protein YgfZ